MIAAPPKAAADPPAAIATTLPMSTLWSDLKGFIVLCVVTSGVAVSMAVRVANVTRDTCSDALIVFV